MGGHLAGRPQENSTPAGLMLWHRRCHSPVLDAMWPYCAHGGSDTSDPSRAYAQQSASIGLKKIQGVTTSTYLHVINLSPANSGR